MNVKAIYPGSFDPITNGHLDIIERASKLYDEVTVLVAVSSQKKPFFTCEERVEMIKEAVKHIPNVKVDFYQGLTVKYALEHGAKVLVRGLRAVSDFEYEFQLSAANNYISKEIEMVFLMSNTSSHFISSSTVKELFLNGHSLEGLVPANVISKFNLKK